MNISLSSASAPITANFLIAGDKRLSQDEAELTPKDNIIPPPDDAQSLASADREKQRPVELLAVASEGSENTIVAPNDGREAKINADSQFANKLEGSSGSSSSKPSEDDSGNKADSGAIAPALTEAELQQVKELAARDREVRAHEAAHANVGGRYAGGASFSYERGPDGKNYSVAGEVAIDIAAIAGDPQATIAKAQVVQRAALAPAQPSAQDRAVAAAASALEADARAQLLQSSDDASSAVTATDSNDRSTTSESTTERATTRSTSAENETVQASAAAQFSLVSQLSVVDGNETSQQQIDLLV